MTRPENEPSNSEVLAAVRALTNRFEQLATSSKQLATKEDLVTFKAEVKAEVKQEVVQQVKAVKAELKTELLQELGGQGGGGGGASGETWKEKDKKDPARKQVAVLGWPEGVSAGKRLEELEELLKNKLPDFRPVTYSNEYKGLYNNRHLGKAAYVHLASEDEARNLVKAVKDRGVTYEVEGKKLRLAPAKTAFFKQRDWAFNKAEELLKANAAGGKVEVERKERTVKVNGAEAFKQQKEDSKGSFLGSFAHLALPS